MLCLGGNDAGADVRVYGFSTKTSRALTCMLHVVFDVPTSRKLHVVFGWQKKENKMVWDLRLGRCVGGVLVNAQCRESVGRVCEQGVCMWQEEKRLMGWRCVKHK